MSAERLGVLSQQLGHSSYDVNIEILSEWESLAISMDEEEKVVSLTEALINSGREDLLVDILPCEPSQEQMSTGSGNNSRA